LIDMAVLPIEEDAEGEEEEEEEKQANPEIEAELKQLEDRVITHRENEVSPQESEELTDGLILKRPSERDEDTFEEKKEEDGPDP